MNLTNKKKTFKFLVCIILNLQLLNENSYLKFQIKKIIFLYFIIFFLFLKCFFKKYTKFFKLKKIQHDKKIKHVQ